MTRQAHQQKRLREQGLCLRCWQPSGGHVHCDACREKNTIYQRHKVGCNPWQPGKRGRPPIVKPEPN